MVLCSGFPFRDLRDTAVPKPGKPQVQPVEKPQEQVSATVDHNKVSRMIQDG